MKPNAAIAFFVFLVFLIVSSAIYHAIAAAGCRYETRVRHVEGGGTAVVTVRICCDANGRCTETVVRRR
jgi:hypothetical protein